MNSNLKLINAAVATTLASAGEMPTWYSQPVNISLGLNVSATVTGGTATVRVEAQVNGVWYKLKEYALSSSTVVNATGIEQFTGLVCTGLRAYVSAYSSLVATATPVAITLDAAVTSSNIRAIE